LEEVVLYTHVA